MEAHATGTRTQQVGSVELRVTFHHHCGVPATTSVNLQRLHLLDGGHSRKQTAAMEID